MKKIVLLTTDTAHHRFFINRWLSSNLPMEVCLFETKKYNNLPYKIGPLFDYEERDFEEKNFFQNISRDIPKKLTSNVVDVNSIKARDMLKEINPDFGVVFGTGLIKPSTINLFHDGLINVHRGIAEKYRGLDSDLWAIYHRDYNNLGVTVHRVDNNLDTGELVKQDFLTPKLGMRISHIRYHTTVIATDLIIDSLKDYLAGKLHSTKQFNRGRYYSFMPLSIKRQVEKQFNDYCMKL